MMLNQHSVVVGSARRRSLRRLRPRAAYALMAAVIGLALFASGTPSPLYTTYQALFSLSPLTLTLVYATYAFGVLATLLLAGPVSDTAGRRPVLLVALGSLMVATLLFTLADSVVWLFIARGIQGLATGLALSTASAALLDLHPRHDPNAVGLHNGVASAAGMGLGVLISAAIVQLLPAPRVLPYLVAFVFFAAAFGLMLALDDPVVRSGRLRLHPQRPVIPAGVRPAFALAGLAAISSWSIGGLALALGPELAATLFHSSDQLVGSLSVLALAGPAAISQLVFRNSPPWAGATAGSMALAIGLLGIMLAAALDSGLVYILANILAGTGFGAAFLGALRTLTRTIPPTRRSSVMSAFYLVAYGSLSVPAILAGALATPLGLNTTFEILGALFAAVALVAAALAFRSRPEPATSPTCTATPARQKAGTAVLDLT
jgi:predicted MFS family arabinose efflux permease